LIASKLKAFIIQGLASLILFLAAWFYAKLELKEKISRFFAALFLSFSLIVLLSVMITNFRFSHLIEILIFTATIGYLYVWFVFLNLLELKEKHQYLLKVIIGTLSAAGIFLLLGGVLDPSELRRKPKSACSGPRTPPSNMLEPLTT